MDERTDDWKNNPAITGLLLIAALISPAGAPFLGLITMGACDIPWEGPYQCIVPEPVFAYFFLSWGAPFFFLGLFALVWFALCVAVLVMVVRLFGRSVWGVLEPHL